MKLTPEISQRINQIAAYDAESFTIGSRRYPHSLIVTPETVVADWTPAGFAALQGADIERICALAPALVLLGTGQRQHFPPPALLRPLVEARIGFEVMDTGSACRTFNLLAAEGRRVAAALLLDPAV